MTGSSPNETDSTPNDLLWRARTSAGPTWPCGRPPLKSATEPESRRVYDLKSACCSFDSGPIVKFNVSGEVRQIKSRVFNKNDQRMLHSKTGIVNTQVGRQRLECVGAPINRWMRHLPLYIAFKIMKHVKWVIFHNKRREKITMKSKKWSPQLKSFLGYCFLFHQHLN